MLCVCRCVGMDFSPSASQRSPARRDDFDLSDYHPRHPRECGLPRSYRDDPEEKTLSAWSPTTLRYQCPPQLHDKLEFWYTHKLRTCRICTTKFPVSFLLILVKRIRSSLEGRRTVFAAHRTFGLNMNEMKEQDEGEAEDSWLVRSSRMTNKRSIAKFLGDLHFLITIGRLRVSDIGTDLAKVESITPFIEIACGKLAGQSSLIICRQRQR
ncbi:hypothetical protein HZH66_010177 [Vespula vulgaris]|uniref:Uncharacterized protein n=1 Tax=Vespula vulgaris TaxID=7454 RepID=A0A834MXM1_VESVU|nr:hypothetical protein HZH66_010177 [Vespula vulgaris]